MSSNFWFELTLALLLLGSGIGLVHQYKFGSIRRLRATWLRRSILQTLDQLLSELTTPAQSNASAGFSPNGFSSDHFSSDYFSSDYFAVFRLRADIEQDYQRADVLFEEERVVLADFLSAISGLIARAESGFDTSQDLEKAILSGQRAVLEITEIGS